MTNNPETLNNMIGATLTSIVQLRTALHLCSNTILHSNTIEMASQTYLDAVPNLVKLIESGILVANAFELLLKISPTDAQDVLIRYYLSEHVDPDSRYGSYLSNLALMLSDVVESLGQSSLENLLLDARVSTERLSDSRVTQAVGDALDLDNVASRVFIDAVIAKRNYSSQRET